MNFILSRSAGIPHIVELISQMDSLNRLAFALTGVRGQLDARAAVTLRQTVLSDVRRIDTHRNPGLRAGIN